MTDLKKYLNKTSKQEVLKLAKLASENVEVFHKLIECALSDIQPESKRAVWAVDMLFDLNKELITPYLPQIFKRLPEFKEERNQGSFLHLFTRMTFELSTDNLGLLFDFCLDILRAEKVQMYMKFYAMQVLENMGKQIPELIPEICMEIEENIDLFDREHLKNTAREIIKGLQGYTA